MCIKTDGRVVLATLMVVCMVVCVAGQQTDSVPATDKPYDDPARFEAEIQQFEAEDQRQLPPPGAVLCVGSSSIRLWHEWIREDLEPLTIIPRGFGGSNMNDALHYADRIVSPYRPRAIVIYEGDNDIAQGVAPQRICDTFRAFVAKVHEQNADCRIYFLSIKPSIQRWQLWPAMQQANELIAAVCNGDERLTFVDLSAAMLGDVGTPRPELFQEDQLHLARKGYLLWKAVLRPILLQAELPFENGPEADRTAGACPAGRF